MSIDIAKNVLITGGTKGLGKSIGMAFSRYGANVFLTHRWGSVDESSLEDEFLSAGLNKPFILCSDVADADDLKELMNFIQQQAGELNAIISNVAFAQVINGVDSLKKNALDLSLNYSAWPLVALIQQAKETFNKCPEYVVAISSDGPDFCHPGYDMAALCKSVLETLTRYLAVQLKNDGVNINCIRPGFLETDSTVDTFGAKTLSRIKEKMPDLFIDVDNVAKSVVALCSELMTAVNGQVICVDEAWSLVSPISYLTEKSPFKR